VLSSIAGLIAVLQNTVMFICPASLQKNFRSTECERNINSPDCFCNRKGDTELGEDAEAEFLISSIKSIASSIGSKVSSLANRARKKLLSSSSLKAFLFSKVKALGGPQIRKLIIYLVGKKEFKEKQLDCLCESLILPWADGVHKPIMDPGLFLKGYHKLEDKSDTWEGYTRKNRPDPFHFHVHLVSKEEMIAAGHDWNKVAIYKSAVDQEKYAKSVQDAAKCRWRFEIEYMNCVKDESCRTGDWFTSTCNAVANTGPFMGWENQDGTEVTAKSGFSLETNRLNKRHYCRTIQCQPNKDTCNGGAVMDRTVKVYVEKGGENTVCKQAGPYYDGIVRTFVGFVAITSNLLATAHCSDVSQCKGSE